MAGNWEIGNDQPPPWGMQIKGASPMALDQID